MKKGDAFVRLVGVGMLLKEEDANFYHARVAFHEFGDQVFGDMGFASTILESAMMHILLNPCASEINSREAATLLILDRRSESKSFAGKRRIGKENRQVEPAGIKVEELLPANRVGNKMSNVF
jgi:hypothetical protein